MSPCLCGAIDCPSCGGVGSYDPLPECEACYTPSDALADYYKGAPGGPQEPLWLCDDCTQARAERAWESSLDDFYGGDRPTEAMVMEAARRLK